jgi:hypothetical protein
MEAGKSNRKSCLGAGLHVGGTQGGARWMDRGTCRTCGKSLKLTPSGRIPRHVPAPEAKGVYAPRQCEGSGKSWGAGTGTPICRVCHVGPRSLGTSTTRRQGRYTGTVPTHADRHDIAGQERKVKADYVAGTIDRPTFNLALAELHAALCQPGTQCVCMGCRAVREGNLEG